MFKRIKRLPLYFIGLATILIILFIFISTTEKVEGFLIMNRYHSWVLDIFFRITTNLGDGILSVLGGVVLLIQRKRKKAITLLVAYASSSVLAQLLKELLIYRVQD